MANNQGQFIVLYCVCGSVGVFDSNSTREKKSRTNWKQNTSMKRKDATSDETISVNDDKNLSKKTERSTDSWWQHSMREFTRHSFARLATCHISNQINPKLISTLFLLFRKQDNIVLSIRTLIDVLLFELYYLLSAFLVFSPIYFNGWLSMSFEWARDVLSFFLFSFFH